MSVIKIIGSPEGEPNALTLLVSPDSIEVGDELEGGYEITKIGPAEHQNHEALRFSLADSGGNREVGRLVLRRDGVKDAALQVTRWFDTREEADLFWRKFKAGLPAGARQVKVRALEAGQEFLLDGEFKEIESVNIAVHPSGRPTVEIFLKGETGALSRPPENLVWVL